MYLFEVRPVEDVVENTLIFRVDKIKLIDGNYLCLPEFCFDFFDYSLFVFNQLVHFL